MEGRSSATAQRPSSTSRPARLARRRANEEGLADVAYATLDSPLGTRLWSRPRRRGLVRVALPNERHDDVLDGSWPRTLAAGARVPRRASTRCGASSTSTSRAGGTASSCRSTGGSATGSTRRVLRSHHEGAVRRDDDLRARWPPSGPATRAPTARPAPRWARTRSRSSSPATASFATGGGLGGYGGGPGHEAVPAAAWRERWIDRCPGGLARKRGSARSGCGRDARRQSRAPGREAEEAAVSSLHIACQCATIGSR